MKKINLGIIFLIVLVLVIKCVDIPEEDGILVLLDSNIEKAVRKCQHLLAFFYIVDSQCQLCSFVRSEFTKAAQILKKENIDICFGKGDGSQNNSFSKKFRFGKYPAIRLVSDRIITNYIVFRAGFTYPEIVTWVHKKLGPIIHTFNSAAEVEEFHQHHEMVTIYFGRDKAELEVFEAESKESDEFLFGSCSHESCYSTFDASPGTIILFKKFDDKRNYLKEKFSQEKLKKFLFNYGNPMIMEFDQKSAELIFDKSNPGLFLFYDKNLPNATDLEKVLASISRDLVGRIKVVATDIVTSDIKIKLAEIFGVASKDLPTVRIQDTRNDGELKYKMEGNITEKNILKFVEDWENGKLQNVYKSEEIPVKQEGDVYTLVGYNFNQVVLDPMRDVFVMFYKSSQKKNSNFKAFEILASKLIHNSNFICAQLNTEKNDFDLLTIKGETNFFWEHKFPIFILWPANNKENPVKFKGKLTDEKIFEFFKEHSTHQVTKKEEL